VHAIKAVLKMHMEHIWHPTKWECILRNLFNLAVT